MPRPWFKASMHNTTMAFLMRGEGRVAPLTEGERLLGHFVLPPFQRPPVWTRGQQVAFLESAWGGLPLGSFVLNRPSRYGSPFDNWLLDGQQRVTAVLAYLADEYPVLGYCYSEITDRDRRQWMMAMSFPYLEVQSEDPAELEDIYNRLAYGGTAHEPRVAPND